MRAGTTVLAEASPQVGTRVADYLALTRPRVAVLVLVTVGAGAWLATRGALNAVALLHTLVGTTLVAGGASALNQLLERHTDALMRRTENRPLPAGRLQPFEVLIFGVLSSLGGVTYLALVQQPLAALVAAAAFTSYVFLYTPLKRRTTLNTLVGAIPGALPPVIGWAAASGAIDSGAAILFLIVFLWQVPHFLAIAWIYREDYARAGLVMLPVVDAQGDATGRQMVNYCLALIPVSLMPAVAGAAGSVYGVGALGLGLGFFGLTLGFACHHSRRQARRVLQASLLYLPALLALLLADGFLKG